MRPSGRHSVLSDFRDRLLDEGRADRLLDLALARLKEDGLVRERADQQDPAWHKRYVRSGIEGTVNEFAHAHGMRHCR